MGERLDLISYLSRSKKPETSKLIEEQIEEVEKLAKSGEEQFVKELLEKAKKGETKAQISKAVVPLDFEEEGIFAEALEKDSIVFWW